MALRTRRNFLLFAANDANVYTDLTKDSAKRGEVSYPEPHPRQREPVPPGAGSTAAFLRKCVGCLKCIPACPRGLLRVSAKPAHLGRPALDFRHGWCYPECNLCAAACPAGALGDVCRSGRDGLRAVRGRDGARPSPKTGLAVRGRDGARPSPKTGLAVWNREACLAAKGVTCNACLRHCPVKAITHAKDGTPVIDAETCIGCGACEYHCPTRPRTAIHVEGRS